MQEYNKMWTVTLFIATFSLFDLHFDTYFRPRLILLLMGLHFAAVYRGAI